MMKLPALRPDAEADHPPTGGRFHHVRVAERLDGIVWLIAMREQGIRGIRQERPKWRITAGNRNTVTVTRAALGDHQKILAVYLVKMRSLRPHAAGAFPNFLHG